MKLGDSRRRPIGKTHRDIVVAAATQHGVRTVLTVLNQHGYRNFRDCPADRRPELIDAICRIGTEEELPG